jgi:hypothetical protein
MSAVGPDFNFLLDCPKDEILSVFRLASVKGNNVAFVGWEFCINGGNLSKKSLVFEATAIEYMCAFIGAYGKIAAKGWKYSFADGIVES